MERLWKRMSISFWTKISALKGSTFRSICCVLSKLGYCQTILKERYWHLKGAVNIFFWANCLTLYFEISMFQMPVGYGYSYTVPLPKVKDGRNRAITCSDFTAIAISSTFYTCFDLLWIVMDLLYNNPELPLTVSTVSACDSLATIRRCISLIWSIDRLIDWVVYRNTRRIIRSVVEL